MKDLLGREIKTGNTVAVIAKDYSIATGGTMGRTYLQTFVVTGAAAFAVQLEGGRVITSTEDVAIVEMSRNVWAS